MSIAADAFRRNCYLNNEKMLKLHKFYSEQNCKKECQSDFIVNRCGCVPYYVISKFNFACNFFIIGNLLTGLGRFRFYFVKYFQEIQRSRHATPLSYIVIRKLSTSIRRALKTVAIAIHPVNN